MKPVELDLTAAQTREGLADLVEFNRDYDRLQAAREPPDADEKPTDDRRN